MEFKYNFTAHPTEEILEAYALNRLDAERIPSLEMHLLACETCQDAVAEVDHLIATMKLVTSQSSDLQESPAVSPQHERELRESKAPAGQQGRKPSSSSAASSSTDREQIPGLSSTPAAVPFWNRLGERLSVFLRTPLLVGPALTCGVALALFLLLAPRAMWPANATPTSVTLSSYRGNENVVTAPAGAPLDLGIESTQLAASPGFRLELVDDSGKSMWQGQVTDAGRGRVSAKVMNKLSPGRYWVRLYNLNAQLVQEFGLKLE